MRVVSVAASVSSQLARGHDGADAARTRLGLGARQHASLREPRPPSARRERSRQPGSDGHVHQLNYCLMVQKGL
jgi:hypothetical protein